MVLPTGARCDSGQSTPLPEIREQGKGNAMRIGVVSSSELLRKSWGAVHHFPGDVSEDAKRLVAAWKTAVRVHEQTPDEGSAAMLQIISELASKRARSKPTGNYADRASVKVDRELFERTGIPLSE